MPFSSTAGWAGHVGGPFSSHESVAPLAGVNEPKEQLQDPAVVRSDERDIDASKTAATPESAPRRMGLIMVALSMACFLAILDTSIITTALPTIANHFHATQISYSWIGSSYLLTQSAFTPLWGKLSDIFGRKPTVLLANVIFFVGSLVCALANGIPMLIAGRAIQGVGAGGLLVIVTIILGDLASPRYAKDLPSGKAHECPRTDLRDTGSAENISGSSVWSTRSPCPPDRSSEAHW